jgi:hypothetical protein
MRRQRLEELPILTTADAADGVIAIDTPWGDIDFVPESREGDGFVLLPDGGRLGYLAADFAYPEGGEVVHAWVALSPDKTRRLGRYPSQAEAISALFGAKENR